MKKFLLMLICAVVLVLCMSGLAACVNYENETVKVYMPDGAPALSMARLMAEENKFEKDVEYNVVDANTVQSYVTGASPKADLCVLPLNAASKLLGSGENYKMLGTVTHGNLFILKKQGGEDITRENLSSLKGKTIGVIQLANVPGLILKIILNDAGIQFNDLGNSGQIFEDKVNLKAVNATDVLPTDASCDYFVVPEPNASTKIKATKGKLEFAGSLQQLYSTGDGYPQAVLVAKNSLINSSGKFIADFIKQMKTNSIWLENEDITAETVVNAISANITEGLTPAFTAANLTKSVIKNCAVNFVPAERCKVEANAFLDKMIAVNPSAASTVSENFYFING